MERLLPACCDMCPSVALCQLLLNLWSATAISAQATSAKQNSKKKKKTSRTNSIRIIHATYGRLFKIKIQFNSFEQSLQIWHKFLQIAAAFGAICSKGPYGIYYIVGALQKWPNLSKSLTFSFFSNLNSEKILYDFTARFFPV